MCCSDIKPLYKIEDSSYYIHKQLIGKVKEERLEVYNEVTMEDDKIKVKNLKVTVSSHRIILEAHSHHAFLIDGESMREVSVSDEGILWMKQFYVHVRTATGRVKLYFQNCQEAHITLLSMLKNKAWAQQPSSGEGKLYTGLFNKLEKEKDTINQNAEMVGASFASFDTLFSNLKQMKQVMKDIKDTTGEVDGDDSDVKHILKDIGFMPVYSKEEAGRDYYRHLAHDLYSICSATLFPKYGGMVSLLDLFYFYNMKRQMQLLSPEELYQACKQFQSFGFNAKLVTYPNNVKIIESTSFDQQADFQQQFKKYFLDFKTGYSPEKMARQKGIPLAIVQIKLKKAAERGVLAVDKRIQGVKYFKNLFLTI